jgi:hypothetical protein
MSERIGGPNWPEINADNRIDEFFFATGKGPVARRWCNCLSGSPSCATSTGSRQAHSQRRAHRVSRRIPLSRAALNCLFRPDKIFFFENYNVQADLDVVEKIGRVEISPVGLFSGENKDSDRKSYITTIKAKGNGSEVTTTGPLRNTAYIENLLNIQWASGEPSCALRH